MKRKLAKVKINGHSIRYCNKNTKR